LIRQQPAGKEQGSMPASADTAGGGGNNQRARRALSASHHGIFADTGKAMEAVINAQTDAELNDDFTGIYSSLGVVGALLLSLTFTYGGEPISCDGKGESSLWGSHCDTAAQVHGMLFGLGTVVNVWIVQESVTLLMRLGEIPKSKTKMLLKHLGHGLVNMPNLLVDASCCLFALGVCVQYSINFHSWVSITQIVAVVGVTVVRVRLSAGPYSRARAAVLEVSPWRSCW
jgi:hypothetical protein